MCMRVAIARGSAYSGLLVNEKLWRKRELIQRTKRTFLHVEHYEHSSWIDINQDDQHIK